MDLHIHIHVAKTPKPPKPHKTEAATLRIDVDGQSFTHNLEDSYMHPMQLGEKATLRLNPRTAPNTSGQTHPAELDLQDQPINWTTADPAVVAVTPAADGLTAEVEALGPGDSRVAAIGDADKDAGEVREISGFIDIHVVAEASTLDIVVDPPVA